MQKNTMGRVITSSFQAPKWAKNRHVQTIFPRFFQKRKALSIKWEKLSLPDGDFTDLAWGPIPAESKGLVILFHGLEGCVRSHYANDLMASLTENGWQTVMMHFRGCSGKPNATTRAYHSGDTADALYFLAKLQQDYPSTPKCAVGVSLGGNMLLKLLGETPYEHGLKAAIAISSPLKLDECSMTMNQGFSKVYQKHLLKNMKRNLKKKMAILDYSNAIALRANEVDSITNFKAFDDAITAPLHGFDSADDYYQKCSGFQFLKTIQCPTLILHAKDDPFMNEKVIPKNEDLSDHVSVELSENGGHVGFLQGTPWRPSIWLHQRVAQFFTQQVIKE
ncbi:hydrolase [Alteromonas sp. 5E99-2]|uniref:hydrolase n=1 Tax=Alteromonas sp. 5E99-2 TaxID=2817683 RepID=UPI001A98EC88|nr:hydrolase [Alteromonas sp. 5E99-2]MBO1256845.1 hydrolase [Alteromonas sp. 5E99-2]